MFPSASVNVEAYIDAATVLSSRAFFVDEHHGDGMIPVPPMPMCADLRLNLH